MQKPLLKSLPKGSWNFKAVGWNGSPMQGDSQCGNTDVSIKDNAQTVTINVSAAGCDTPEFGANGTLSGSFIFKPMRFITCGALYESFASNLAVTSATCLLYTSPS